MTSTDVGSAVGLAVGIAVGLAVGLLEGPALDLPDGLRLLRSIRDLEGELSDREHVSAEHERGEADAQAKRECAELKRDQDANVRRVSRLKEELDDMRTRERKERNAEAGERDARARALESELAD